MTPLRTIAVLAATSVLTLSVPLLLIFASGDRVRSEVVTLPAGNAYQKLIVANAVRPFVPTTDSTITPLAAGEAFQALRASRDRASLGGFVFRDDVTPATPVWDEVPFPDSLFPTAGRTSWLGPDPLRILAVARGPLSAAQRDYLRALANASGWRLWDRLAAAAQADLIDGQFVLPFADSASWFSMPIPRFASTKSYAYASVTRAAHHLAEGRADSASAALQSAIGVGFALVDNGNTLIDQLIGVVIVGIARGALEELWTITKDPRGAMLTAAVAAATEASTRPNAPAVATRGREVEQAALERLGVCTTLRGVLFGPDEEADRTLALRRAALARSPGEHALFDLIAAMPDARTDGVWFVNTDTRPWYTAPVLSIAEVTGAVLRNPRVAPCTALVFAR
jgi:hypothetical protein